MELSSIERKGVVEFDPHPPPLPQGEEFESPRSKSDNISYNFQPSPVMIGRLVEPLNVHEVAP